MTEEYQLQKEYLLSDIERDQVWMEAKLRQLGIDVGKLMQRLKRARYTQSKLRELDPWGKKVPKGRPKRNG